MKPSLLVIELHHLGDGVLALPFLKAASQKYQVSVLCTASVAEMLQTFCPEVEVLAKASDWPGRFRQGRALRLRQFSVTACAWADTRCHLMARLAEAKRRIGFPANRRNFYATHLAWRRRRLLVGQFIETAARWAGRSLLTDELNRAQPAQPHLQNWAQIATLLDLPYSLETPWFPPPTARPLFENTSGPVWVLHAGGRLPTKRWPLSRYQELLEQYFAPRNLPVIIVQPPGEEAPVPVGPWQTLMPCETHTDLARAIVQGDCFLGNDSYAAHVAAALGKKVVTIFGSGNPDWFAPYGQRNRVCDSSICPYHPCIDRCVMPDYICLKDVEMSQVTQQLEHI